MSSKHPNTKLSNAPSGQKQRPLKTASKQLFPVVGIGASSGGLEACKKLLDCLPADTGMAFILVQHLDPTHASLLVELLSRHTAMVVSEAEEGTRIEPDHLYIIPPATYLACGAGSLHLSLPDAPHGARLPYDFLLRSMAAEYTNRAFCLVLSGSGADGSEGLRDIHAAGGYILVQNPAEAGSDGMPSRAIETGLVDAILPLAEIPAALLAHKIQTANRAETNTKPPNPADEDFMPQIIDHLRRNTAHDFTQYKPGTLARRVSRRMALSAVPSHQMAHYLDILKTNPDETKRLATDLLINVTSFFRDRDVFDLLETTTIPELIKQSQPTEPLRVWIAGCSTGEEAYTLAMLFICAIEQSKKTVKLQIFASDVDADAIAIAREGAFSEASCATIAKPLMDRFFTKCRNGYTISNELRNAVVFTVQDILSDPPFSRLDLISCRNLMIYLSAEAQKKVMSVFHFALREHGLLLLGNAETAGQIERRFEIVSKPARLYRRIGQARWSEIGFSLKAGGAERVLARSSQIPLADRHALLSEQVRKQVMDTYAPASVLINSQHECVYSLGDMDKFLQLSKGYLRLDLFAMTPGTMHAALRLAIQKVTETKLRTRILGLKLTRDDKARTFSLDAQPISIDSEDFLLISFLDEQSVPDREGNVTVSTDAERILALEREIEAAIVRLRDSEEDQRVFSEEALSFNEEYQSANEELLTSKEELQSLNEELTALNSQLHESLERQRTTSDDLQNVLYSTDVATLFLDRALKIRFFTPATKALFNVIATDIGRPLADLFSLAVDVNFEADARLVLAHGKPVEREIEARNGAWYIRRILPYVTQDNTVEGIVATFADITDRKQTADTLEGMKKQAQLANAAKSRFLAAASHDLRQPLQTLTLLQGLLERQITEPKALSLLERFGETLGSMAGMLNTLLDINQIEAGTVRAEISRFPVSELLSRMKDEFMDSAAAHGLELRVVQSTAVVKSDPRLLEQMVRNLLSNAIKYTKKGKIVLGCRTRNGVFSIEIADSGIGVSKDDLEFIFEEFHQVDNIARERHRGLGLGLAIVKRLGKLLGHAIHVRSTLGKGSVFSLDITRSTSHEDRNPAGRASSPASARTAKTAGTILLIEDNGQVSELLDMLLTNEGYTVIVAPDGFSALTKINRDKRVPDLVLADFNLPNGMNGLQLAARLRKLFGSKLPVIILTGDISTGTLRDIAVQNCVQLNKPVKVDVMLDMISRITGQAESLKKYPKPAAIKAPSPKDRTEVIYVVDDDRHVREALRAVLEDDRRIVEDFASCEAFLDSFQDSRDACLLIDAYLPGMDGMELLKRLASDGHRLPSIMITGNSDVTMAVQAMKAGAFDFIEKPVNREELIASVNRALLQSVDKNERAAWTDKASQAIMGLTARQKQIMDMVLAGHPSKNIAADLKISQRTVENHRAAIMQKTGSKSLPALARLALAATSGK
ncbi:MAG: hypothetical protein RIR97_258 [Pseudomonadota bacterium]